MITCNIRRKGGPTTLTIDAREFHAHLERMGVERGSDGFYKERPTVGTYDNTSDSTLINTRSNTVTTNLLLKCDGPHEIRLDGYYTTPPRLEVLKALADSVGTKAREILEHYQPIDVAITVVAPKPPTEAP